MRILLLIVLLLISLTISAQSEKLTNQSILDMIELGFSDDIIMTKIKTSEFSFDTSIEALKALKEKGVSDDIIVTIMNMQLHQTNEKTSTETNKAGIYYNDGDMYVKIYPSVFSGTKTNTLGASFSYGIASSDIRSTINNRESNNVIKSDQPEFWFYFSPGNNIDLGNWWFFSATSPNEFVLVRLDQKKKSRELKTGSVNIYSGTNIGVAERHIIPFAIEVIDENTFKVSPKEPLEDGEYCFFYQGAIPNGGYSNQSIFDFSIKSGKKVNKKYRERWGKEYMDDTYE